MTAGASISAGLNCRSTVSTTVSRFASTHFPLCNLAQFPVPWQGASCFRFTLEHDMTADYECADLSNGNRIEGGGRSRGFGCVLSYVVWKFPLFLLSGRRLK